MFPLVSVDRGASGKVMEDLVMVIMAETQIESIDLDEGSVIGGYVILSEHSVRFQVLGV
jgi:hypothetical protein